MMQPPSPTPSFLGRFWFPLALIGLLLLATPGYVLFGMNRVGKQGEINRWLHDTFNLSYNIQIPWWGALLLLLMPLAIILLYFLKLKRKPLSVPSTFLWRKSIEDLHVNSLLQWLRQNVLLLLQLLVLVALIYAIMAFQFHGRGGEGKHYIVMVDNSASMSAADVAPTRLDKAKEEALQEIDAASDHDIGMVIVFNSSAQVLQSYTSQKDLLRNAVRSIQPTQRPTRIDEALSFADSLANYTRSTEDVAARPPGVEPGKERTYVPAEGTPTEVHLFSDGRFPDVPEFALGNLTLQWHLIGKIGPENTDNLALVTCNAVRDDNDSARLQVFVRVLNFRPQEARTGVEVEVYVDGTRRDIQEQPLQLPARRVVAEPDASAPGGSRLRDTPGEGVVTFDLADLDDRANVVLHLRLRPEVRDPYPLDDEAWLVVGVIRKARVLIVGANSEVLPKFFNSASARRVANVEYITAEQLKDRDKYLTPASTGAFDLVIFDRCAPEKETDLPRANSFFIGYPPPPWTPADTEKIDNPHIKAWMSRSPILQYLTGLHEVLIGEAFKLKELPPRTPMLIETAGNVPLLFTLNRSSYTDLVLAFPIINEKREWNTKWPLQPQFPLFLRNVLYTLGHVYDAASEETVQPGQVMTLRPDVTVDDVRVTDPGGRTTTLERDNRAEFFYSPTDRVGVYRVVWDGGGRSFAVNLLDSQESNLEPRTSIQIGAEQIAAGQETAQPRPMWKVCVLAALGLLMLEWYIYNRRVYV